MQELTTLLSTLGIVGGGGAIVSWVIFTGIKKRLVDLEKIPNLENRVSQLEQQAMSHNETRDIIIRLKEQVKNLSENVKSLSDLLMRKVLNNNG